jgi:tetratricopeptide (TPR) repeat protein
MYPHFLLALLALAGLAPLAGHASETSCDSAIQVAETQYPDIPAGLLGAIGRVESGRAVGNGRLRPWPYTLNVEGAGYHFNGLTEAVAFLRENQNGQTRSIDIGCMQVNLRHHPEAFAQHAQGFDAQRNVDYAARFLVSLRERHGSWAAAVMRYHSGDPVRQSAYLGRVRKHWRDTASLAVAADTPGGPGTASAGTPLTGPEQAMQSARQRFANGDYVGAARLCESAKNTPGWQQEAALCLGMAAESTGMPHDALGHYLQLLVAEPTHGPALRSMTRLAQYHPKVFHDWEKNQPSERQWREAAHALPLLLTLSRSRLPQAAHYLGNARTLARAQRDVQTLWVVALRYENTGQLAVARQLYEELLLALPQRAPGLVSAMQPLVRERLQRLPSPSPTPVASASDTLPQDPDHVRP